MENGNVLTFVERKEDEEIPKINICGYTVETVATGGQKTFKKCLQLIIKSFTYLKHNMKYLFQFLKHFFTLMIVFLLHFAPFFMLIGKCMPDVISSVFPLHVIHFLYIHVKCTLHI